MGCFEKSGWKQSFVPNPRLVQLDRELMEEGSKRFDYVYAVRNSPGRGAERYKVCVERMQDDRFFASTWAVGRVFRSVDVTPAGAFVKVIRSLRFGLDRWIVDQQYHAELKARQPRRA